MRHEKNRIKHWSPTFLPFSEKVALTCSSEKAESYVAEFLPGDVLLPLLFYCYPSSFCYLLVGIDDVQKCPVSVAVLAIPAHVVIHLPLQGPELLLCGLNFDVQGSEAPFLILAALFRRLRRSVIFVLGLRSGCWFDIIPIDVRFFAGSPFAFVFLGVR